jgi:Holliday junction DNA helicase RuvA
MIASLAGQIQFIEKDALVVAVGGVGVRVFVPKTVMENIGVGHPISLHTHLIVREQELSLYGFTALDDLRLFTTMLTVRGIGAKVGLAILSTLSPELIQTAVMQEEAVILQRVPGIGKKTAQAIIFQLRDKIDFSELSSAPLVSDVDADVIDVLTTLGFSIVEAQTAIQKLPRNITAVDERVGLALQQLDMG